MMGSWAVILATCGLVCLGIGVGGRLDARTAGWMFLLTLLFLTLAMMLHVSSLLLRGRSRRR